MAEAAAEAEASAAAVETLSPSGRKRRNERRRVRWERKKRRVNGRLRAFVSGNETTIALSRQFLRFATKFYEKDVREETTWRRR